MSTAGTFEYLYGFTREVLLFIISQERILDFTVSAQNSDKIVEIAFPTPYFVANPLYYPSQLLNFF